MADRVLPGPVDGTACIREAVCIHTKKIFDSCRDRDWPLCERRGALARRARKGPIHEGRSALFRMYAAHMRPSSLFSASFTPNAGCHAPDIRRAAAELMSAVT